MKKIIAALSLAAIAGGLTIGALNGGSKRVKQAEADASYQTYVPISSGWIENTDGSAVTELGNAIRGRNDRFWTGGSGWDAQERTFNAMDDFVDTIHRANGGEGWRGAYRTPELVLHDNDHRYISFLFGGGAPRTLDPGTEQERVEDIFINIFQVSGDAGSGDRITGIRTSFDGRGSLEDAGHLNAPISCNMVFKYFELPSEIKPGDHFLIYVRDGKTGDYGGFTFGDVHINQTLEDVAKSFSAHKAQMKLNEFTSAYNAAANEFVLDYYANDSFYATVRTAEAALTDANDDFEVNNRLSKWAYDQQNSTFENGDLASINFDYIYSTSDHKEGEYFYENDGLMPLNKTGNQFLSGEPTGIAEGVHDCGLPESAKYRLVSPAFKLSGTGLISAKLGGHYSKLSLLDSNYNVLLTTGNNPSFVDTNMSNIITSGARMCTMIRTYLDCSAYLNQTVHVAIEDSQVGGGWNLAFFDEIVTKYTSLPSFKLDVIAQSSSKSEAVYNGVVFDKLVVGETYNADFKAAYDFVTSYYAAARTAANDFSRCSVDTTALISTYDGLSANAKAVVDSSEDYFYGDNLGHFDGDYFLAPVNKNFTIGQAITAIKTGVYPVSSSSAIINNFRIEKNGGVVIAFMAIVSFLTLVLGYAVLKKRKVHK